VAAIGQLALYPAVVAALAAMLRRSAAGRGVLWTFSRRGMVGSLSPTRTVRLWVGLTVAAAVLAAVLQA